MKAEEAYFLSTAYTDKAISDIPTPTPTPTPTGMNKFVVKVIVDDGSAELDDMSYSDILDAYNSGDYLVLSIRGTGFANGLSDIPMTWSQIIPEQCAIFVFTLFELGNDFGITEVAIDCVEESCIYTSEKVAFKN